MQHDQQKRVIARRLRPVFEVLETRVLRSATVTKDISRERDASALFSSYDSTGTILTDISLSAGVQTDAATGEPLSKIATVGISVTSVDQAAGRFLITAQGESSSQKVNIDSSLGTATVTAVIPLVDQFGLAFTAKVDMTWSQTGPVDKNKSETITLAPPGMTVVTKFVGDGDDAVATGTIRLTANAAHALVANATPLPSFEGSMQRVVNGTTTITMSNPSAPLPTVVSDVFSTALILLDGSDQDGAFVSPATT